MAKRYVPDEEREEFFELVCSGMSVTAAAAAAGVSRNAGISWWRSSGLVSPVIQFGRSGGLPGSAAPAVPGARGPDDLDRRRRPLSSWDRSVIAVGLRCKASYAQIAALVGRDKSVVWREVVRNRGPDGSYSPSIAHRAAHERRRRPKTFKLHANPGLCRRIEGWMDEGWSPGLIAALLRREHPGTSAAARMSRVSHETIYQALYVQTRGSLRQDLARKLSTARRSRKPRSDLERRANSPYREAFKISQRPAEVTDRAVPGHWEGDLILGSANGSAVGTLVERSTRFVILLHLPGRHDAASVAEAMIREMGKLPAHLHRSLTWDRGVEMAGYRNIQLALDMPVYFCDPHSPWQRGSNENTNRLLRFWLEKGTDLSQHTAGDLARIAATLNKRPRPTLDYKTPAQALAELLSNPTAA
nr:IS30 family transposase [Nocardioides abyssi]